MHVIYFILLNFILLLTTLILKKYSLDDICRILDFLIDNIFVTFGGHVFQQTVGIPMEHSQWKILYVLVLAERYPTWENNHFIGHEAR